MRVVSVLILISPSCLYPALCRNVADSVVEVVSGGRQVAEPSPTPTRWDRSPEMIVLAKSGGLSMLSFNLQLRDSKKEKKNGNSTTTECRAMGSVVPDAWESATHCEIMVCNTRGLKWPRKLQNSQLCCSPSREWLGWSKVRHRYWIPAPRAEYLTDTLRSLQECVTLVEPPKSHPKSH